MKKNWIRLQQQNFAFNPSIPTQGVGHFLGHTKINRYFLRAAPAPLFLPLTIAQWNKRTNGSSC